MTNARNYFRAFFSHLLFIYLPNHAILTVPLAVIKLIVGLADNGFVIGKVVAGAHADSNCYGDILLFKSHFGIADFLA